MVVALICGELAAFLGTKWCVILVILYSVFMVGSIFNEYIGGLIFVGKDKNLDFYKIIIELMLLIFMLLGVLSLHSQREIIKKYDELQYGGDISNRENIRVDIAGTVNSIERKTHQYIITISTGEGLVYAYTDSVDGIKYGAGLRVEGTIKPMEEAKNFGNYDERSQLHSKGVILKVKADKWNMVGKEEDYNQVAEALRSVKKYLESILYEITDEEEYGIIAAMVLGNTSDIDRDTKELYSLCGISHIMSISGQHISLLGMGLYRLLRLRMRYLSSATVSGGVMACFLLLIGSPVSAVRAVIMFIMHVMADVLGRKYDLLSAVSLSAIILLLKNPYYLFNSSFQLSFGAITTISVVVPIFTRFVDVKKKWINVLLFNFLITLALLPANCFLFYRQSTYCVAINMIIGPLMGVVLIMSIIGIVAGMVCLPLGNFFIAAAVYILRFYKFICEAFMKFPYASVVMGKLSLGEVILEYAVLALILFTMWKSSRRVKWRLYVVLALLCSFIVIAYREKNYAAAVCFLDVGQGDCAYIKSEAGNDYLIDGGSLDESLVGQYRIESFLEAMDVDKLEYVFVSHMDTDHVSGIIELIERGRIEIDCIVLGDYGEYDNSHGEKGDGIYGKNGHDGDSAVDVGFTEGKEAKQELINQAINQDIEVIYIGTGEKISDGSITFTCLSPSAKEKYEDVNEASLVLIAETDSLRMVFAGDIGEKTEKLILPDVKNYIETLGEKKTILKVAHHGSKYSSCEEFIDAISPSIAVISYGKDNRYGHPHWEVIVRLKEAGAELKETGGTGQVKIKLRE